MLSLLVLMLGTSAHAVPMELTHQGRILDSTGAPLTGAQPVTFSLYYDPSGGSPVWQDTFSPEFDNGFFSVVLGSQNGLSDELFEGDDLFLQTQVGSGTALPSRLKINSVPFAVRAQSAVSVTGGGAVDAASISVGGTEVIDGSGAYQGTVSWSQIENAPTDSDTLGELSCTDNGQVAVWSGSVWICGTAALPAELPTDRLVGTISPDNLQFGEGDGDVAEGSHIHSFPDIQGQLAEGQLPDALPFNRLPVGTTDVTVAQGDHSHDLDALSGTLTSNQLPDEVVLQGGLQLGTSTTTCDISTLGLLRLDETTPAIEWCDGEVWKSVARSGTLGLSPSDPGRNCSEIKQDDPTAIDGTYWINPDSGSAVQVYCDMTTDGGGWTLVAKTNGTGDSHLSPSDTNLAALSSQNTDANATMGNAKRNGSGQFYRFTCNNNTRYAYVDNTSTNAMDYWQDTRPTAWTPNSSFTTNTSAYTESNRQDCGSATCVGPAYEGRNWRRIGFEGCGLYGGYNSTGTWWARE